MTLVTGSSVSPRRIVPPSMRRLGFGSYRSGLRRPLWMASVPTTGPPSSSLNTAEGSCGDPSNSCWWTRPSARRMDTTVWEVPKSTLIDPVRGLSLDMQPL